MVTEINDEGLKLQKKILMKSNNIHLAFPFSAILFVLPKLFWVAIICCIVEPFPPFE